MSTKKPMLLLFAGPNGSGKSTITSHFDMVGEYTNADDVVASTGISIVDAAKLVDERRYCVDFAPSMIYEKSKMEYLLNSNNTSYKDDDICSDVTSDINRGIKCFRRLVPYITQYIPVDVSVSDKELYCQFVAANYFCNIEIDVSDD